MPRLLINCTHGKEDPERATLPFIVGNVAASADQEAVVLLTIEGVWNATKGYADTICKEGFQPLKEVMQVICRKWRSDLGLWCLRQTAWHLRIRHGQWREDRFCSQCRRMACFRSIVAQFLKVQRARI